MANLIEDKPIGNKKKPEKAKKQKKSADNYNPEDVDFLNEITKNVDQWYSYYSEHIERARNYLTFLYVDQWELSVRQAREAMSRPTMTFNKLVSVIRGILGEWRNNSPNLAVSGCGEEINQETVNIYEGLLSHIQYASDSDICYQVAGKHALECGWGALRVVAEYEGPNTFRQVLRIKPIMDYQAAFWDPTAVEPSKADGDYCGVYTNMSLEHFKRIYPQIESPQAAGGMGDTYYLPWSTRESILVCEIYKKEYFNKKIYQLSDGNEVSEEQKKEIMDMQEKILTSDIGMEMMDHQPLEVVNEREVQDYKIRHIKFIQNHILDESDYPGKILPIPYAEGDSTVIDGQQIPLPFIQDAIDSQKLINYIGSEMAYLVLRSRKETAMGTAEHFAGYEDIWNNADQVQGPLLYNETETANSKPEFITPPTLNSGMLQIYTSSSEDIMHILGRFEESRGEASNAIAARAIDLRQRSANKPVNLYGDNLQRAIKQCGKICIEMIPFIYDTERTIMIRTGDGQSQAVQINQQSGFKMLPDGDVQPNIKNDLTAGKYEVEVRVDGSFDSQQAEAMNTLIQLAQINPAVANLTGDLMAEVSGLTNAKQVADRLRTLVPPNIIAQEEGKPPPPPPQPMEDPNIKIQNDKNQIANRELDVKLSQQQLDFKKLALEEQKLLMDAEEKGVDKEVSLAKAAAEVHKVNVGKDIAIINHGSAMKNAHTKMHESSQRAKRETA